MWVLHLLYFYLITLPGSEHENQYRYYTGCIYFAQFMDHNKINKFGVM